MEASDTIWTVFQGLGAILAVALTVGLAVINLAKARRVKAEANRSASTAEIGQLESTVAELVGVLGGTEQTKFHAATPGIVARFDKLEEKVIAHDDKLEQIAEGVQTLLEDRA